VGNPLADTFIFTVFAIKLNPFSEHIFESSFYLFPFYFILTNNFFNSIHIKSIFLCIEVFMRTNIVLDDKLVEEGMRLTGVKTKRELVNLALRELIERRRRKNLLKFEGKIEWEGNLNEIRRSRF